MATVHGVSVQILRGGTAPLRQRVDTWFIPGRQGVGAQLMGSNTSSFIYRAILYGADANVNSRLASLYAAQGAIGSIVDDFGDVNGNSLIVSVSEPVRTRVIHEGSEGMRAEVRVSGVRV